MTGMKVKNAQRVVLLIEQADGTQDGWEILAPCTLEWTWTGLGADGSTARMVANGTFHRMRKDNASRALEERLNAEVQGALDRSDTIALPRGDGDGVD